MEGSGRNGFVDLVSGERVRTSWSYETAQGSEERAGAGWRSLVCGLNKSWLQLWSVVSLKLEVRMISTWEP